jgi:AraC-like DNA-binding protein/ligand-binding sensor protein
VEKLFPLLFHPEFANLANLVAELLRMPLDLYWTKGGERITCFYSSRQYLPESKKNKVCLLVSNSPLGNFYCQRSDREAVEKAILTKEPVVYTCHVGLTDIIVPINYYSPPHLFISTGQLCLSSKNKLNLGKYKKHLKRHQINFEDFLEAYQSVPFTSPEKLSQILVLLQFLAQCFREYLGKKNFTFAYLKNLLSEENEVYRHFRDDTPISHRLLKKVLPILPNTVILIRTSLSFLGHLSRRTYLNIKEGLEKITNPHPSLILPYPGGGFVILLYLRGGEGEGEKIKNKTRTFFTKKYQAETKVEMAQIKRRSLNILPLLYRKLQIQSLPEEKDKNITPSYFTPSEERLLSFLNAQMLPEARRIFTQLCAVKCFDFFPLPALSKVDLIYLLKRIHLGTEEIIPEVSDFTFPSPEVEKIIRTSSLPEVYSLARRSLERHIATLQEKTLSRTPRLIQKIKEVLNENYLNPNIVRILVRELRYSDTFLRKIFKKSTGKSFVDYVVEAKINKAKELLEHSALTIQEIADRLGYNTSPSLYKVFKKKTGLAPGEYRRQKKEKV